MNMPQKRKMPTIVELIKTVESLGFIKSTNEETYSVLDSKDARKEFDQFHDYMKKSTESGSECYVAEVSQEGLDRFSRLYTKLTGRKFDPDKDIIRLNWSDLFYRNFS